MFAKRASDVVEVYCRVAVGTAVLPAQMSVWGITVPGFVTPVNTVGGVQYAAVVAPGWSAFVVSCAHVHAQSVPGVRVLPSA
jgi:hypothetical protein